MKTGSAIGLGAGIAAAAVGAALGAYLLTGDRAAKTKKVLKSWVLKAKGEVLEQLENLEEITEEGYDKIVDEVARKYSKMAGVSKAEVEEMADGLKKNWRAVSKTVTKKVKKLAK